MRDVLALIDDFRRFAEKRVAAGDRRSVDDFFQDWLDEGPPWLSETDDLLAIEESLRDFDAGDRGRPSKEVMEEIRRKYGLQ